MFGFPSSYSYYDAPQRSYDPFGGMSYGRPTHRPQQHTSFNRNPYGYQYDPRYQYQNDSSDEEEEEYTRPQRVAPQQQVRLDHLTPQQKLYLQQQQQLREQQRRRQQQQQQLQREQEEQEEEEEEQHQHQRKHHHPHRQQSAQHHRAHHAQQAQQPQQPQPQHKQAPQPQRPQKAVLKEVDLDKEALRIQRRWRGWQVRRHDLISKLRSLSKIEGEVDELESTPINRQILSLDTSGPLPSDLDNYYVGNIPRNVLMLEHELTAKLLALDEISGHSEIIRPRRKGLVTKIEQTLSKVDAIKKVYNTMTPPPNPTPVVSTPEDSHHQPMDTDSHQPMDTTTTTTQIKKKESDSHSTSDLDTPVIEETDSNGVAASMGTMGIQDISEPTPTTPAPSISTLAPSSSTSIPTTTTTPSFDRVMPLKQMCYNLCDSLIKKSLLVH